ncbi:MAG: hypothetical protein M1308_05030 [Actinobacteria bacterium]|nr:hypothetical protein [Actinomycetota bacterium]
MFNKLKKKEVNKKNKVLFGFSIQTNPSERQNAYNYFTSNGLFEEIKIKINSKRYLNLLKTYKFVASPQGNGLDCHRTWEAIYLGVIPIVKKSVAMEYFAENGLPIWIVDDWAYLDFINEDILEMKYKGFCSRSSNKEIIFMDYWLKKIKESIQ